MLLVTGKIFLDSDTPPDKVLKYVAPPLLVTANKGYPALAPEFSTTPKPYGLLLIGLISAV